MSEKTPYTLKEDLYDFLRNQRKIPEEISAWVGSDIAKSLNNQLSGPRPDRKGTLRLSNLGTPCERRLWYHVNSDSKPEPLPPSTLNKFIFGDITESYLLGLCKAAGHNVTGMQDRLDVHGIIGHRDCIIDGMLFDVKSASSFSFKKFAEHRLREVDTFGYLSQLSSYLYASQSDPNLKYKDKAAFLAFDKQFGHIAVDIYDLSDLLQQKEDEVKRKKSVVKSSQPPKRAFEDVPHNRSGNMKLDTNCSYCEWKHECWPNLRTFLYANGPLHLTKVVKEPSGSVFEVGKDGNF